MSKYKKGDMFVVEITDNNCKVGLGDFKCCLNGVTYVTEEMLDEFTRIVNGPYNEDYLAGYTKACESYKKILKTLLHMTIRDRKKVFGQNFTENVIEKFDPREIQEKLDLYEKAKAEELKSNLCPRCTKECKIDVNRCEFGKFTNAVIKCPDFEDKDKIRVGDVVRNILKPDFTLIVTAVKETKEGTMFAGVSNCATRGLCNYGDTYENRRACYWEKTGKHYDEIEKLFDKSGE